MALLELKNVGWVGSISAVTKFASLYEAFNPLTIVAKQHFIEWFSGNNVDSIWTREDVIGGGSHGIVDAVDEGAFVLPNNVAGNRSQLNFGGIRPFAHDGSVWIAVLRRVDDASANKVYVGLGDGDVDLSTTDKAVIENNQSPTFISSQTSNGTSETSSNTTKTTDNTFRSYKGELDGSNFFMTIDGDSEVTITTNLPNSKMEPNIMGRFSVGTGEVRCRYLEVYNT